MKSMGICKLPKGLLWIPLTFIFSSFLLNGQVPFDCKNQFFLSLNVGGSSKLSLVKTDPNTGLVVFETLSNDVGTRINAIGYRSSDNLIYAIHPTDYRLFRIDATGSMELLTTLDLNINHTFLSGEITPDGNTMILIGSRGGISVGSDIELIKLDLNDPDYGYSSIDISDPLIRMLDISIDPVGGDLFGFDSRNNRLIKMDYNNGEILSDYPFISGVSNIGSIFFDAFGNLYGYGNSGEGISQNTLFKIDTKTGNLQTIAQGPNGQGTDGCSCPYTIEISKKVIPEISYACSEVEYTFTLVNSSGFNQPGVILEDQLPEGFIIKEIKTNPYGGEIISGVGENFLQIENIDVFPGIDSITIAVEFGNLTKGIYRNQATLKNLPSHLGNIRFSDNPSTLIIGDSTNLEIQKFGKNQFTKDTVKCIGDSIKLDISNYGTNYLWNDGSKDPIVHAVQAGTYQAHSIAGCDTLSIDYNVWDSDIDLHFDESSIDIELGDEIILNARFSEEFGYVDLIWDDPLQNSLSCHVCKSTRALPFQNVVYQVNAINEIGCRDSSFIELKVDKTRKIYIPNIFSPNGDGSNDAFYLQGRGHARIIDLKVYDRWGSIVHELKNDWINNRSTAWDGTIHGQQSSPGVYTYFAKIEFLDRYVKDYSGTVLLSR